MKVLEQFEYSDLCFKIINKFFTNVCRVMRHERVVEHGALIEADTGRREREREDHRSNSIGEIGEGRRRGRGRRRDEPADECHLSRRHQFLRKPVFPLAAATIASSSPGLLTQTGANKRIAYKVQTIMLLCQPMILYIACALNQ